MEGILEGHFAPPANEASQLRLVSWNIERGERIQGVTRFVQSFGPNLCSFQEVDLNTRRTARAHIAEGFARDLKFNYAFGTAFRELTQGPEAYMGQAVFSSLKLQRPRLIRFRYQSSFWKPRWWVPDTPPFQEREGGRIALVSEVPVNGGFLIVYNVHLESRGPEKLRALQLEEVVRDASRYPARTPIVIAGDMNTKRRWSPCIEVMKGAGFTDAVGDPERFTTNRGGKFARLFIDGALDWIWVRGDLKVSEAKVHTDVIASDHFPLTAVLEPLAGRA